MPIVTDLLQTAVVLGEESGKREMETGGMRVAVQSSPCLRLCLFFLAELDQTLHLWGRVSVNS